MPRRLAFTLVEMLVVIGIMALLIAMAIPAIQRVRAAADRTACLSNLRQLGIAMHHYHTDHQHLPPGRYNNSRDANSVLSLWTQLLPYVEQDPVAKNAVLVSAQEPKAWKNPPHTGLSTVIKVYICPTDIRLLSPLTDADGITAAYQSYLGVEGGADHDGMFAEQFGRGGIRLNDARDGLSHTLLLGERPPPDTLQAGQWYSGTWFATGVYAANRGPDHSLHIVQPSTGNDSCKPTYYFSPGDTTNPCDRFHFWSFHGQGGNFIFADGSARFLPYRIDQSILVALATRSGGESIEIPE